MEQESMMPQIIMPNRPSQGESLVQVLGIAGSIFGIKNAIQAQELASKHLEEANAVSEERKAVAAGQITPTMMMQQKFAGKNVYGGEDLSKLSEADKANVQMFKNQKGEDVGIDRLTPEQRMASKAATIGYTKSILEVNNLIKKPGEDKMKLDREQQTALTTKKDVIEKQFQPFERLYGSIGELKQKWMDGKLNPQDEIQLVRLLVPLSEINPGVVRESEAAMVQSAQSTLGQISSYANQKATGEPLGNTVVKQLFDTADSLRPVVANQKIDLLTNLAGEVNDASLGGKLNIILGNRNVELLKNPSMFANFSINSKKDTPPALLSRDAPKVTNRAFSLLEDEINERSKVGMK